MSKLLEAILKNADSGFITEIFFWLILGILIISCVLRKSGKGSSLVN